MDYRELLREALADPDSAFEHALDAKDPVAVALVSFATPGTAPDRAVARFRAVLTQAPAVSIGDASRRLSATRASEAASHGKSPASPATHLEGGALVFLVKTAPSPDPPALSTSRGARGG